MKTIIYFILTCFISTGAFLAATNMKNPWPAFTVAFGSWALFFWGWNRRLKKQAGRRSKERLFEDFLRSNLRQRNR